MQLAPTDCLLIIDVQNDFLPGGALAVPDGDQIIPVVNQLAQAFGRVVLTQDWHPREHVSFAANHAGAQPFGTIELPYGQQVLWPVHCVQHSTGAALAEGLSVPHAQLIVRKGHHPRIDSYSALFEADRKTPTGLLGYLRELAVERVFCVGLATDFCVAWSALDAREAGLEVAVIEDACRAIDLDGSLAQAWQRMADAGIARLQSQEILNG